ncbi:MAG: ATP-binding protein [Desulfobacteraceae bacterium]|nr:MAG: ATP-binding protein [Desulfobacteraceae bacterium]
MGIPLNKRFGGFQGAPGSVLWRLSRTATVEELASALRLPVARSTSPLCIRKHTDPHYKNLKDVIIFGSDIQNPALVKCLDFSALVKHLSVFGMTGSGKTIVVKNVLLQLHERDIPFLVIEPFKTEYRIFKTFESHPSAVARSLVKKLEIYTPGNDSISPLRFNPLELLDGIAIDEHIGNLLACFKAAIPMEGSLPALIAEGLERLYEQHCDRNHPPLMVDLVSATQQVLKEKGYAAEVHSNMRAMIEARLGVLTRRNIGRVFQCRKSVPSIEHIMGVPAVIEFYALEQTEGSLMSLFLKNGIRERLKTLQKQEKDPRYVIVIEEAHNIVGRTGEAVASPEVADPRAFAADFVVRMVAELRAPGVSVIVVDQSPSAVAPPLIKNTGSKVVLRLVDREDREMIGASMLMSPTEIEELGRLTPGEAFFFTEGDYRPRRIYTKNLEKEFSFKTSVENERILPYLNNDPWYHEAAVKRTLDELDILREKMNAFDLERVKICRELQAVLARYTKSASCSDLTQRMAGIKAEKAKLRTLRQRLIHQYDVFLRDVYRRYLQLETPVEVVDSVVREMRDDLVHRHNDVIKPDLESAIKIIDEFLNYYRNP